MAKRSVEYFPTSAPNTSLSKEMEKPMGAAMVPVKETQRVDNDRVVENSINQSLLDPSKFGWAALGGVGEMLPPHQSARRKSSKRSLSTRQKQRFGSKRARSESALEGTASLTESFGSSAYNEPVGRAAKVPIKSQTTTPSETSPKRDSQAPLQRFKALERGMLNVKTYHRGIEGDEPRDEQTGELLYLTKPSDSGLTTSGPSSLEAFVTIQFPLSDVLSADLDESSFYRQTVRWDLGNPRTPTPILYAGKIATEFGLSYAETLDLACSIQKQLQIFCADKCPSAVPTLIKHGLPKPPPTMCHLYGDVTGFNSLGGLGIVQPKRPVLSTSQRSNSSVTSKSGAKTKLDKDSSAKRKAPPGPVPAPGPERSSDSTEKIFYRQILARLKRAADEYIGSNRVSSSEMQVKDVGEGQCHLCQEEYEKVLQFPCGIQGHTLCEKHMLQKHGISLQSSTTTVTECPICSLRCGCSFCNCKHSMLAYRLKKMCLQQGAKPQTTHMQGIHSQCVGITMTDCREFLRTNSTARNFLLRPQVPKLNPDAFPREVIDGFEIDLEYQEHYEMVFTSSGGQKQRENDNPQKRKDNLTNDVPPSTPERIDAVTPTAIDGNTDFCMVCSKVGSLICCDVCPRAFHWDCVPNGYTAPVDGKQWVCPACQAERDGLPSDMIDGSKHFEKMKYTYSHPDPKDGDADLVKVLSIILEMIDVLINYDFGYMFSTPVNPKQVPGYDKIVKSPMDLGTIKSYLVSGRYAKTLGSDYNIENAILAVLKDIELVWHNCLLFNTEGSAVYRMSGVLSRRSSAIRQKNFDSIIPIETKDKLAMYIDGLESERAEAQRLVPRPPASIPRNRHKVANCAKGAPQRRRPIVGLDPDTGMVTKLYSTMLSFSNAVNILMSKGVMCEYKGQEIDNTNKLRTFVTRSSSDPSIRLFGYRWLFLNELYERKVLFQDDMYSRTNKEEDEIFKSTTETLRWGITVQTSDGITCFRNFEEALSMINCTSDHNAENLRQSLKEAGTATCDGLTITRLTNGKPRPEPSILKQDTVAGGRTLMGFSNIGGAFRDWKDAMESSASNYSGRLSIEAFRDFYLGKERSVDGVRYFIVPQEESIAKPSADNSSFPTSEVAKEKAVTKSDVNVEAASSHSIAPDTTPNTGETEGKLAKEQEESIVASSKPSMEKEAASVETEKPEIAVQNGSNRGVTVDAKPPGNRGVTVDAKPPGVVSSPVVNENLGLNGQTVLGVDQVRDK